MKTLKLADGLSLPLDAVTQTIAILAKRRAGKSYAMRRLIEQLHGAGQQIVIVDPKGDQWGVRSSADGKAPGLPVVILGGERGDVPLESTAGEVVAKLVVEERVSALLDLSLFRKHELATFMAIFLETLYRLKAREEFRTPMMLVIDEADAVAPQKPQANEARMLGAAEDIVRRGGQRGIGCVLVTQRSAVLNKNVLTQAQILIALRTIAPQDLAAMNAWIDVHGTIEQKKTLMESLPSLPVGDAWVWSPGWPTVDGIFKRVHILPIETFDSGKSPDPGTKKPVEPKQVADVDLDALKRQMSATIEKAKADDPKELRKQLAEAKALLAQKEKALVEVDARTKRIDEKLQRVEGQPLSRARAEQAAKLAELKTALAQHRRALEAAVKILVKVQAVDFPVETNEDRKALEQAVAAAVRQVTGPIEKRVTALAGRVEGMKKDAAAAAAAIAQLLDEKIDLAVQVQKSEPFRVTSSAAQKPRLTSRAGGECDLAPGERKILTAVAQFGQVDRGQLTVLVGYKATARDTYISRLAQKGFVESGQGQVRITQAGVDALGSDYEPLPTGAALLAYWRGRLAPGECKVLDAAVATYPQPISRADIGERTQYKPTARDTYISRLASRRLLRSDGRGSVVASEELFS